MRMPRLARSTLLFSLLILPGLTPAGRAQTTTPAPGTTAPDATATPPAEARHRDRPISDGLAASLAQSMPKYNPPPKPKADEETDEMVDLRDVDKPRNRIIRLPKYVVQEPKPPVFRERDIYSARNRATLGMQRYPGLGFSPLSNLNRPVALAMYQEEERLQDIADLQDTARTIGVADKAGGVYLKRLTDETFMRSGGDSSLDGLGDSWSGIRPK